MKVVMMNKVMFKMHCMNFVFCVVDMFVDNFVTYADNAGNCNDQACSSIVQQRKMSNTVQSTAAGGQVVGEL